VYTKGETCHSIVFNKLKRRSAIAIAIATATAFGRLRISTLLSEYAFFSEFLFSRLSLKLFASYFLLDC
jgi:hypothetical protein